MRDDTVTTLRGFDSYEIRLGDELRGERATLGKSLLDVQRELKIKAAYIDAIENCDASVFPNPGYVAGYVRAYARYLGLDAEEVYRRFCAESGFESVNRALVEPRRGRRPAPAAAQPPRGLPDEMLSRARHLPRTSAGLSAEALSGLGSVLVLVALVAGLAYGGWYLLREVQRIGFAPMVQAPEVAGLPEAPPLPAVETAAVLPVLEEAPDAALHEIYAPRLPAPPKVAPRDGPLAAIDPDRYGAFAPGPRRAAPMPAATAPVSDAPAAATPALAEAPQAQPAPPAPPEPPAVAITVTDNAWVRVFLPDNTVVLERILKPGETWQVPADLTGPMLRAGNAGAVYLRVGEVLYGPLGEGASVVRRVSLDANTIAASWPRATEPPARVTAQR